MSYRSDTKYFDKIANQKVKCKYCGHVIIFLGKLPSVICTHCGHKVYKNDREEFKDRVKSKIKQKKKL